MERQNEMKKEELHRKDALAATKARVDERKAELEEEARRKEEDALKKAEKQREKRKKKEEEMNTMTKKLEEETSDMHSELQKIEASAKEARNRLNKPNYDVGEDDDDDDDENRDSFSHLKSRTKSLMRASRPSQLGIQTFDEFDFSIADDLDALEEVDEAEEKRLQIEAMLEEAKKANANKTYTDDDDEAERYSIERARMKQRTASLMRAARPSQMRIQTFDQSMKFDFSLGDDLTALEEVDEAEEKRLQIEAMLEEAKKANANKTFTEDDEDEKSPREHGQMRSRTNALMGAARPSQMRIQTFDQSEKLTFDLNDINESEEIDDAEEKRQQIEAMLMEAKKANANKKFTDDDDEAEEVPMERTRSNATTKALMPSTRTSQLGIKTFDQSFKLNFNLDDELNDLEEVDEAEEEREKIEAMLMEARKANEHKKFGEDEDEENLMDSVHTKARTKALMPSTRTSQLGIQAFDESLNLNFDDGLTDLEEVDEEDKSEEEQIDDKGEVELEPQQADEEEQIKNSLSEKPTEDGDCVEADSIEGDAQEEAVMAVQSEEKIEEVETKKAKKEKKTKKGKEKKSLEEKEKKMTKEKGKKGKEKKTEEKEQTDEKGKKMKKTKEKAKKGKEKKTEEKEETDEKGKKTKKEKTVKKTKKKSDDDDSSVTTLKEKKTKGKKKTSKKK